MRVLDITIQGFRSFGMEQTLELPNEYGLNMLTGQNKRSPRLGANATGKSSVWDALTWCLFGKTVRGLRGPDVVNWSGEHATHVIVRFMRARITYTVMRTQDPNTLTLESKPYRDMKYKYGVQPTEAAIVDQKVIDDLLGCNYASWLATVMMGQFNTFFFDMSGPDKLAVFSEALELDKWVVASKYAATVAKDAANDAALRALAVAQHTATLKSLKESRATAKDAVAEFDASAKTDMDGAKKVCDAAERAAKESLRVYDEYMTILAKRLVQKEDLEAKTRKLLDDVKQHAVGMEKHQQDIATCRADIEETKRAYNKALQPGQMCPWCRQKIGEKHVDSYKEHMEQLIQFTEAEIKLAEDRWSAANASHKKAKRLWAGSQEEVQGLAERVRKIAGGLDVARHAMEADKEHAIGARVHLSHAKGNKNPHVDTVEKITVRIKEENDALEMAEAKLKQANNKHATHAEWAASFKDVRLWVIEQALVQLEADTNNSLLELGLEGWEVTFDVERETKSGTVSRGFDVLIKSPTSKGRVKWEAWCGGETQRLRLAGAMGLASVIRSRCNIDAKLEVWDEPTAHLSEEGVQDLTHFMSLRAIEDHKQIWIVDHRSITHGAIGETFVVVLKNSGSRIVRANHDYTDEEQVAKEQD